MTKSADLSIKEMKVRLAASTVSFGQDRIVEYSARLHMEFTDGAMMEALRELREPWVSV